MKPLRTFVSIVTAVLVVASMPASVTARSPRMQAIRELPVAVQSERAAQLQQYVTRTGALGTYWDTASDQIVVVTPASGTSSFKTTDLDSLGLDLRLERGPIRIVVRRDAREPPPGTRRVSQALRRGRTVTWDG